MHNLCNLSDKCFLVTGASSGIGREIAITISRMGGRVLLTGRNEESLFETIKLMEQPDTHIIEVFDLSQVERISTWIEEITDRHSIKFAGMVYAAGIFKLKTLFVTEYLEAARLMDVNFFAAVYMLKYMARKSVCSNGSSFVFITSVTAEIGEVGLLGYGASKAALNSAVRSASLELARSGYRVNAVAPAAVETKMFTEYTNKLEENQLSEFRKKFPLGIGRPSDVANMTAFLLSESSSWITGSIFNVDGGYSTGK